MKLTVERGKKYHVALLAGIMTAILTYFIMQVLGTILAQYGLFKSWALIKSPPSGAARIIGIHGGGWSMRYEVWIETQDRQIFSAPVCSDNQNCDPPQWKLRPTVPTSTSWFFTDSRGTDCKNLGEFPLNPSGQIVECVYAVDTSIDLVPQVYFALMPDGSIKYFVIDLNNYFRVQMRFLTISVLLYCVMLVLVFRLKNYVAKQIQINRERRTYQLSG